MKGDISLFLGWAIFRTIFACNKPQSLTSSLSVANGKKSAIQALTGALFLILLACIPAAIAWSKLNANEEVLLPDELTIHDPRVSAKNVVWIDARSEQDYEQGHVTGAILLTEEKWEFQLGNLFQAWKPDHPIVVYCNAGCEASHKVADRLRDLGLDPIYVLKGGYETWKQNLAEAPMHL